MRTLMSTMKTADLQYNQIEAGLRRHDLAVAEQCLHPGARAPEQDLDISSFARKIGSYLAAEAVIQVLAAYYFAEKSHRKQTRKDGSPYITHPLAVADILADLHVDQQTLMAALLHDVIEDTKVTEESIDAKFGSQVAMMVNGVSKLVQAFGSRAEKQAENIMKIAVATVKDLRVLLVKLADRLHNMRTLGALSLDKRRRIARETLDIYAGVAHRLGMSYFRDQFENLSFRALYPKRYEVIATILQQHRSRWNVVGDPKISDSIKAALKKEGIFAEVVGREKHPYSIYKKMLKDRCSLRNIRDIFGFRIIVDRADTCYRVLGVVHSLFKPVPGFIDDYIGCAKANGYQALHTDLVGPQGVRFEVQIRSRDMDRIAEHGVASHELYKVSNKQSRGRQAVVSKAIKGIMDLYKKTDDGADFLESLKSAMLADEISVFTPKGDIKLLPQGATPIDFAYAMCSKMGNSCKGCLINQERKPLSTTLQDGQTVEIITDPKRTTPRRDWLTLAVTSRARVEIRRGLKRETRESSIIYGRTSLSRSLERYGKALDDIVPERIEEVLHAYEAACFDDLLEYIGSGKSVPQVVASMLVGANDLVLADDSGAISGVHGIAVTYAKCCYPLPGDAVAGHIVDGSLSVHVETCPRMEIVRKKNPTCIQHLVWEKGAKGGFYTNLEVVTSEGRDMITRLVASIPPDTNLVSINKTEVGDGFAQIYMLLIVDDRVHLASIIRRFRSFAAVRRITRVHGGYG